MKGVTLVKDTVVTLALDGALVYVEDIQPTYAAVVAMPDQPAGTNHAKLVFTPGRVGAKKISPYAAADKTVDKATLSPRNLDFLSKFAKLRDEKGPNHVDRTDEELKALEAAAQPQESGRKKREPKEKKARAGKKALKLEERCKQCGEQRGHPDHPSGHAFVEPDPIPDDGSVSAAPPRAKRERQEKLPRRKLSFNGPYQYCTQDEDLKLRVLRSCNPKYEPNNSGMAVIDAVKNGAKTPEDIQLTLATHEKWKSIPLERLQLACKQLLAAGLLENVK